MYDAKQLWETALVDIELNVTRANFNTWFKGTRIIKLEDGIVNLGVPNAFAKDWLYNKYHLLILRVLREKYPTIRSLEYVVCRNDSEHAVEGTPIQNTASCQPSIDDGLSNPVNKSDNLNPKYTFESFIIGAFNELAYAACQAILKKPGLTYNPLFIYGGTGLGKTHLIQAIGNQFKKTDPEKRVFYVTSEQFSMDYITAIQQNKLTTFKEKYRRYDVLIMDDIQFLSNKEKTQEELFHAFNSLHDNNKQIIFSSDKHPAYIPEIEDRLKSRFSAGMIVDVSEPEYESRLAILKSKAMLQNYTLPEESLHFLATEVQGNIRELEGILNVVIMQSSHKGRHLSITEIKSVLKNNTRPKKSVSIKEVIKTVATFYGIGESSLYEKTRRKEVVTPRQVAMFILREDFNVSYPSIGHELGGRDHTTVIHSCEKIKDDIKRNQQLAQQIEHIRAMF